MTEPTLPDRNSFLRDCIGTAVDVEFEQVPNLLLRTLPNGHTQTADEQQDAGRQDHLLQITPALGPGPGLGPQNPPSRSDPPQISRLSGSIQPRGNFPQSRAQHETNIDDSDIETEFYLEDFSHGLKGNIIVAVYQKACRDHSVDEAMVGDTTGMWESTRQVASNDPVGRYFLSTPGVIGARLETEETEEIVLNLLIQMLIVEAMVSLSETAQERWIDEMCERVECSDSDDEEGENYESY